jgi:multidrug resistance efflux pump
LTALQQQIFSETQKLAGAERRRRLVVLRAPADGMVLELGQRSTGSVAKEAEALVTLVPRDKQCASNSMRCRFSGTTPSTARSA